MTTAALRAASVVSGWGSSWDTSRRTFGHDLDDDPVHDTCAKKRRRGPQEDRHQGDQDGNLDERADDSGQGALGGACLEQLAGMRLLSQRKRKVRGGVADAVVVGAGPNGLVAANLLADVGWEVVVLEARPTPGGGVSSANYLGPGWVADVCSAFYPLAVASPVFAALGLEDHGLRWRHAPVVLAHPQPDGRAALLSRDVEATSASVEAFADGDGAAWKRLYGLWERVGHQLLDALLSPFPPLRAAGRLGRAVGAAGALRLARFATLPVRRLAEEEFSGAGGPLLLAGCSLHADLAPESAASSAFGWLLSMLGQDVGFPVPEGGAGQLTAALVRRLESRGGVLLCDHPVTSIEVNQGRATGVVTAGGERFTGQRAVLADVAVTRLYGELVSWDDLPVRLRDDMRRFQWDYSTVKFDWALKAPVPWEAPGVAGAGTVHLAEDLDQMTQYCADIAQGRVPARPFVLLGQLTTSDPSRSPAGTESFYGYTHVPRRVRGDAGNSGIKGAWDEGDLAAMTERVEGCIERYAPGFKSLISNRHVLGPAGLEAHDPNLVGGAINGGTTSIHQQLIFRPTPGLARPETPVRGLYLASASAHPGGAVHGACGSNAARAALRAESGMHRLFTRPVMAAAERALQRHPVPQ
jgi:phytoene dehydrogenase-like protein